jgi:hypothetical protein
MRTPSPHRRAFLAVLLAVLWSPLVTAAPDRATRPFYMGFTPFQYSWVEDTIDTTYEQIHDHADMILHHLDDGVPWPEALAGEPFHENVVENVERRLRLTGDDMKVFVAATPIDFNRKQLAAYWDKKEGGKLPKEWQDRAFDDPEVIEAYLNYCIWLIEKFQPDYFSYGIEVNLLAYNNPDAYPGFIELAKQVYPALKERYPDLPIMLSFYLEPPDRLAETKRHITPLLPYTDIFGISTYPYMVREGPGQTIDEIPENWFDQIDQIAPDKPFAIAETGYIAEDFKAMFSRIEGRKDHQDRYVQWMLSEAAKRDAEFVIWFVVADYDDLWTVLKWVVMFNPLAKAWKDTGLFDGDLKPRPALDTWDRWLERPRRR